MSTPIPTSTTVAPIDFAITSHQDGDGVSIGSALDPLRGVFCPFSTVGDSVLMRAYLNYKGAVVDLDRQFGQPQSWWEFTVALPNGATSGDPFSLTVLAFPGDGVTPDVVHSVNLVFDA
jgi:hypothetical protein